MSRSLAIVGGNADERDKIALTFFSTKVPHPDFIVISPKLSIGIKDIRELEHQIYLKPYSEKQKVIYVKNAQELTPEAQNAFLKTLEEPPDSTIIILSIPTADMLLPTVISRCEIIKTSANQNISSFSDDKDTIDTFFSLISSTLGDTFAYTAKNLLEREIVLSWIEEYQKILRKFMLTSKKQQTQTLPNYTYIKVQEAFKKAKREVNQNVSPRFAMENFFITLQCNV